MTESPNKRRKLNDENISDVSSVSAKSSLESEDTASVGPATTPGSTPQRKGRPKKRRMKVAVANIAQELLEAHPELEWIVSHVMPDKIIWSSHPDILPPHLTISESLKTVEQNVVNTWFVESPVKSEEVYSKIGGPLNDSLDCGSGINSAQERLASYYNFAAQLIRDAGGILVVAGAGIGVDSGLPDYRGPQGFWRDYPGLKCLGLSLEDMSHPEWFISDPCAAWGFYGHRMKLYLEATPHQGFAVLRQILRIKGNEYFVFTSNIDSHFQKAGFQEQKIYEAHGTLAYLQCVNEDCTHVWKPPSHSPIPVKLKTAVQRPPDDDCKLNETDKGVVYTINIADPESLPKCPMCKSLARPNVSMFGDDSVSWKSQRAHAQRHRMYQFLNKFINLHTQTYDKQKTDSSAATTTGELSNKQKKRLLVLEIGCGRSIHSLRCDVELLVQTFPEVDLIRINPDVSEARIVTASQEHGAQVLLPVGAKEGLLSIGSLLGAVSRRPMRLVKSTRGDDYI